LLVLRRDKRKTTAFAQDPIGYVMCVARAEAVALACAKTTEQEAARRAAAAAASASASSSDSALAPKKRSVFEYASHASSVFARVLKSAPATTATATATAASASASSSSSSSSSAAAAKPKPSEVVDLDVMEDEELPGRSGSGGDDALDLSRGGDDAGSGGAADGQQKRDNEQPFALAVPPVLSDAARAVLQRIRDHLRGLHHYVGYARVQLFLEEWAPAAAAASSSSSSSAAAASKP
jgi:hypothetical protein